MQKEYKIRNNRIFYNGSDTGHKIRDNGKIYCNASFTGYKIRDNNKIYKDSVYTGYKIKDNYIYGDGTKIFG